MVPHEPRLVVRRHRKVVVVLAVSIALALSGLGIESASASTRSMLALSLSPDRSNAVRLDGSTVKGQIYVFVRDSENLDKVDFYLDSGRRTKPPVRTETEPPFDLAGTEADGTAVPYDTKGLAEGSHSIRVVLTWSDGTTSSRRANFTVANGVITTPTTAPTAPTTTAPAPSATTTAPAPPADDRCAGAAPDDHCAADHIGSNHDGGRANTNDTARSEWIVAEFASGKDMWQCVVTERTSKRACRCHRRSRREQQLP